MTNLVRGLDEEGMKGLLRGVGDNWKTLDQGAATLVVAGFDPGLDGRQIAVLNYQTDDKKTS